MRAVYADRAELRLVDAPEPSPGPCQLLIRVRAAGLNAADRMVMKGTHVIATSVARPAVSPAALGPIPMGGEAAGEVVATGFGKTRFAVGERVMALCRGAFADFAVVEDGRAMPVPDRLSWAEAGGAPVTTVTAHNALVTAGRLQPRAAVLINAASSGVGVAALQLARLLGAGVVIACSTSTDKLDALSRAGVLFDVGVVATDPEFRQHCLSATGGRGVDIVIDNVGAPSWADNLAVAALGGRIVSVGRLGGLRGEVDFDELARKRVALIGVTFRTRNDEEIGSVVTAAAADVVPALATGAMRVLVDRTFPLEEVVAAEDYLAAGRHLGKVVLLT